MTRRFKKCFSVREPKSEEIRQSKEKGNDIPKKTLRYLPTLQDPLTGEKKQREFSFQFHGKFLIEYYQECYKKERDWLEERQAETEKALVTKDVKTSVKEKIKDWMKKYKENNTHVSERHLNGLKDEIRLYVEPIIGNMQINEVTKDNIQDVFIAMATKVKRGGHVGLSETTKNKVRMTLFSFFQDLADNDKITKNPVQAIKKFKVPPPNPCPPDAVDINDTIAYMEIHSNKRNVLATKIIKETGMRRSEVAGMTIQYFYPDKNVIYMNRTVTNTKSSSCPKSREGGKSQNSVRPISITSNLTNDIQEYIQSAKLKAHPDPKEQFTYVFQDEMGNYLNPNCIGNAYRCIKQRLQNKSEIAVGKTGIHQLRHYQGTTLYRSGMSSDEIKLRLGHASVTTTEKYYIAPDNSVKNDGKAECFAHAEQKEIEKQRNERNKAKP